MFASKSHKPFGKPYVSSALRYTLSTDSRGSGLELKALYSNFRTKEDMDYFNNEEYIASDFTDSKREYLNAYAKYRYKPTFMGVFNFGYEYAHTGYNVENQLSEISDNFLYRCNTHDIYANYSAKLFPWMYLSAGLRAEYYHSNGEQRANGDNFRRNDWIIQPNASLSFTLPKASQSISLSYTNGGSMPWIDKMNPFQRWTSDNSYIVGNPNLEVSKMIYYSGSYSLLGKLYFDASFSHCPNTRMDYTYVDGDGNTVTSTASNGKAKDLSLKLTFQDTYFNFMRVKVSGIAYCNNQKVYLSDQWLKVNSWNWKASAGVKFVIKPWNTNIELFGDYSNGYKGVVQKHKPGYHVSLDVTKTIGDNFMVELILFNLITNKTDIYNDTPDYSYCSHNLKPRRSYSISFTYTFGNAKAKGAYDESQNKMDSLIK